MTRATTPSTTPAELTYDDYMAMPVSKQRCEVVDGVLTIMPSPRFTHQSIQGNLWRELENLGSAQDVGKALLAPADVFIRKRPKLRVRQPDDLFFSNGRAGFRVRDDLDRLQDEGIAPDLAVEILSPGQTEQTLAEKLADYASIQVREVWLVDPVAKSVQVLTLADGRYHEFAVFAGDDSVRSPILPGLALPVAPLFG